MKEETGKYLETNEDKNTTFQNLWDTAKVVLRVKFIVIQTYLMKQTKKPQINNLTYHLKKLENDEQSPKSAEGKK